MANYLHLFDKHLKPEGGDNGASPKAIPICEFAEKWCLQRPLLSQRVILKLYSGEKLLDYPVGDHLISEQEWFDTMYDRGYFPPHIKDSIAEGKIFQDILLVVGRRGGKSTMIAIAALYSVYKVCLFDNPQSYYGIQEGTVIEVSVAAKTGKQAERAPFAKIRAICDKAITFGSPLGNIIEEIRSQTIIFITEADKRKKKSLQAKGMRRNYFGSVNIEAYNSNTDSFRGGAVIAAIMDEFAQYAIHKQTGADAAEYFYETLVPSVHQFKQDGRVFILSTPQGKMGKFYELYLDLWEGHQENTIGVKMPSWESWAGIPDTEKAKMTLESMADDPRIAFKWDYKGKKTEDGQPEAFEDAWARTPASVKREYGAEFEGSENQLIPEILVFNPFNKEHAFRWAHLKPITQGIMGRTYVAHADPARTGDAFAVAVGHKEVHPERGEEVIIDFAYRWYVAKRPEYVSPGDQYETVIRQNGPEPAHIKFREVRSFIEKYILMRFNIRLFTLDQWNSQLLIEDLANFVYNKNLMTGIDLLTFGSALNKEKADLFERLMLEHRIHCYYHPLVEKEILGLQKDRFGRVQAGPGEHDDLWDCISVVALKAMELPEFTDQSNSGSPFNVMPVSVNANL